jgi:hypothetical protein
MTATRPHGRKPVRQIPTRCPIGCGWLNAGLDDPVSSSARAIEGRGLFTVKNEGPPTILFCSAGGRNWPDSVAGSFPHGVR